MVGKCGITLWQDDQQAAWEPLHVCAAAKIEELSRLLGSVDRTLLLLQLGNCWQDHRQTTSGSSRKQITVQPWSRLVEPLLHTVTNLSNLTQTHSNLPEFWKPNLWGIAYSRKIIGTRFAHRLKLREGVKKNVFLAKCYTTGEPLPPAVHYLIMPAWCPGLRSASAVRPKCVCRRHIGIFSFQAVIGEGVPAVFHLGHDGRTNDYSFWW